MQRSLFGDYAKTLSFASLLHDENKRGGEATPDIARLPGARFVPAGEPDQGARFSESMIKILTGGDKVAARHLNQGIFEFLPEFKLTLSFNNKPRITGQDEGIWRRIRLVPFEAFIPPEERDKHLTDKIRAEASGMLNWLLDGLRLWLEDGLCVPEAVSETTDEYRS